MAHLFSLVAVLWQLQGARVGWNCHLCLGFFGWDVIHASIPILAFFLTAMDDGSLMSFQWYLRPWTSSNESLDLLSPFVMQSASWAKLWHHRSAVSKFITRCLIASASRPLFLSFRPRQLLADQASAS